MIDANQAGDANYNAAPQAQQSFAVGKGDQTISFTSTAPAPGVAGGPTYTVTATATSGLTVTFSIDPSSAAVCSIASSTVTFLTIGTCTINANQAGNTNFNAAPQVQQMVTVAAPPPTAVADGPSADYTANAGIPIDMPAGFGVLVNDTVNGASIASYGASTGAEQTVLGTATATAQGGFITLGADGSFVYEPPPAMSGTDTFKYTLTNAGGSSIATVTINVAGQAYFIDEVVPATGTRNGSMLRPFAALSDLPTGRGTGGLVFIYAGSYDRTDANAVTLKAGEYLIGQRQPSAEPDDQHVRGGGTCGPALDGQHDQGPHDHRSRRRRNLGDHVRHAHRGNALDQRRRPGAEPQRRHARGELLDRRVDEQPDPGDPAAERRRQPGHHEHDDQREHDSGHPDDRVDREHRLRHHSGRSGVWPRHRWDQPAEQRVGDADVRDDPDHRWLGRRLPARERRRPRRRGSDHHHEPSRDRDADPGFDDAVDVRHHQHRQVQHVGDRPRLRDLRRRQLRRPHVPDPLDQDVERGGARRPREHECRRLDGHRAPGRRRDQRTGGGHRHRHHGADQLLARNHQQQKQPDAGHGPRQRHRDDERAERLDRQRHRHGHPDHRRHGQHHLRRRDHRRRWPAGRDREHHRRGQELHRRDHRRRRWRR
ncbi:MAG: hypothetical protein IPQ07_32995 [Myxococcales bacterium]|nr:hypothetical protein [Myxococcales bacterium]